MLKQEEYDLSLKSIDIVSEKTAAFLEKEAVNRESIVANRLCVEEILLGWLKEGISDSFILKIGSRLKKPCIILECKGRAFNAIEQNLNEPEENNAVLMRNLLNSIGRLPSYSYRNGKNIIEMSFPRETKNGLAEILFAITAALIAAFAIEAIFGAEFVASLLTDVINPLYSAAFRVLGFISGPLIFLSVMWGIYGIGDASTLSLVGKKMILFFLSIIFSIAAVFTLSFPLFDFEIQSELGASSSFKAIFEMFLDIIPPNIIEPFTSGNTLHLIFCAVIFGIAMLFLGKRVSTVADLVEQINCIVQFLMGFISKLIPYFVFLVILKLMLNGTLMIFASVWQLFLIFVGAAVLICFVFTMVTAVSYRLSPLLIIKKSIPTFLIAITTASSAAAFSSNMQSCEKSFGIDNNISAFGIPLGMVLFKTSTTAYYVLLSLFFAKQFGASVSADWLILLAFVSAMLAIATPPIPGGGVAAYTMLFTYLGIPDEALAIVLSMDIIFDFVRTAANMYNLPLALIGVSSNMGKLNLDILRKK